MQALRALLVVHGGDEHAAGVYAHHCARGQVRDGDAGLADELLRLVILMDAAEDDAVLPAAVVQGELQQLLALLHRLAGLDLDGAEVGTAEGLKVHEVREKRLNFDLGEVYGLRLHLLRGGWLGLFLGPGHIQRLHGRDVNTTRT